VQEFFVSNARNRLQGKPFHEAGFLKTLW